MNFHPPNRVSLREPLMDNRMKRALLPLFFATVGFTSCETAHNAAVATFRVIDAPAAYMRRQLGVDEGAQQTTTTTTTTETTGYPEGAAYPPPQPAPGAVVQPLPPPQRRDVTSERSRAVETQPEAEATATPRVAVSSNTPSAPRTSAPKVSPTPRTASSEKADIPYARPVPGKPGYVFSPFDKNGGYVDVTGFAPGSKVKDPYSGKIFLVP